MSPRLLAAALVLAGPTVLAFFSGGFFAEARLTAGIVALLLAAAVAAFAKPPLPRSRPGRIALAGLALLAGLTLLSTLWAPLKGPALDDSQRVILYLAGTFAAAAILRPRALARAVEPAIAFGGLVVIGYALSERLLPGFIDLSQSASAAGRLEQPLTYWNALGALAALALTACARLAGDPTRQPRLRALAVAASAPLGLGLYLSFSRGALAAAAAGIGLLAFLAPTWPQLRGLVLCSVAGTAAAFASAPMSALTRVTGDLGSRETAGAAMLGILVVVMAAASAAQIWLVGAERRGRLSLARFSAPNWAIAAVIVAVAAAAGTAFGVAGGEHGPPVKEARAQRLGTVSSIRYSYWGVALKTFARHPIAGIGSRGFRVEWLRERDVQEDVRDAHSLYLETAAELGLLGLVALGLFLGGVAACAVRVRRRDPLLLGAGPAAVVGVWAVACALDWHWEMPAVTLPALLAVAALIAQADPPGAAEAADSAPAATQPALTGR